MHKFWWKYRLLPVFSKTHSLLILPQEATLWRWQKCHALSNQWRFLEWMMLLSAASSPRETQSFFMAQLKHPSTKFQSSRESLPGVKTYSESSLLLQKSRITLDPKRQQLPWSTLFWSVWSFTRDTWKRERWRRHQKLLLRNLREHGAMKNKLIKLDTQKPQSFSLVCFKLLLEVSPLRWGQRWREHWGSAFLGGSVGTRRCSS